jgi:predicted GTPase
VGHDWEDCDPAAIERYVSEQHNPGNEQSVVSVEVAGQSAPLARDLCLVDTPGLGSVVVTNTIATRAFVPHVDAAFLVLGSDPPITAEELALVREMTPTVREIIVVFNKADRSPPAERMAAIQ